MLGVHLCILASIFFKEKLSKIAGSLLLISGVSYIVCNIIYYLLPQNYHNIAIVLAIPMTAGELYLMFWLFCAAGKKSTVSQGQLRANL